MSTWKHISTESSKVIWNTCSQSVCTPLTAFKVLNLWIGFLFAHLVMAVFSVIHCKTTQTLSGYIGIVNQPPFPSSSTNAWLVWNLFFVRPIQDIKNLVFKPLVHSFGFMIELIVLLEKKNSQIISCIHSLMLFNGLWIARNVCFHGVGFSKGFNTFYRHWI